MPHAMSTRRAELEMHFSTHVSDERDRLTSLLRDRGAIHDEVQHSSGGGAAREDECSSV